MASKTQDSLVTSCGIPPVFRGGSTVFVTCRATAPQELTGRGNGTCGEFQRSLAWTLSSPGLPSTGSRGGPAPCHLAPFPATPGCPEQVKLHQRRLQDLETGLGSPFSITAMLGPSPSLERRGQFTSWACRRRALATRLAAEYVRGVTLRYRLAIDSDHSHCCALPAGGVCG